VTARPREGYGRGFGGDGLNRAAIAVDTFEVSMTDDPYGDATAEFYDLLATGMWEGFGPTLRELLAGARPSDGPIVDVGAGTGAGEPWIRDAVPGARIWAVEPSKAMRTALHARLAADPALRDVVTVVPCRLENAVLPDSLGGVVASAVLGHFDDRARHRFWHVLATRLAPGAPAVVGVLPPTRPEPVPSTRYRELRVGEHVYEGWMEGRVVDERRMHWTMTYRVLRCGRTIYEQAASSEWYTSGPDDVAAEVEPLGLVVERPDDETVVLRRGR
jgi:hypothetical protein